MKSKKKKASPSKPPEVEHVECREIRLNECVIVLGCVATVRAIYASNFIGAAVEQFGHDAIVLFVEDLHGFKLPRKRFVFAPHHLVRRFVIEEKKGKETEE